MNAKALATELGDALKYVSTIRDIERIARAIFPCERRSHPNDAITSQRAQLIYDWVLSVAQHSVDDAQKEHLLVEFAKRITPDELIAEVARIFESNGISERQFDGLVFTISPGPSFSKLTSTVPELERILQDRWIEAQKCQRAGGFLSAVILMGSILEGLLLCRAFGSRPEAYRSKASPKDRKTGDAVPIEDWKLNDLIEVAVDVGWLKLDRGSFSHALRESRNIVHPWEHMAQKADFDEGTCRTCWQVLSAAVGDLTR